MREDEIVDIEEWRVVEPGDPDAPPHAASLPAVIEEPDAPPTQPASGGGFGGGPFVWTSSGSGNGCCLGMTGMIVLALAALVLGCWGLYAFLNWLT